MGAAAHGFDQLTLDQAVHRALHAAGRPESMPSAGLLGKQAQVVLQSDGLQDQAL